MAPPGPPGPKGEPGDPASDDQELTYDHATRTLSLTNSDPVVLGREIAFRAKNTSSDPAIQLAEVTMTYDSPDLSIGGGFDPGTGVFTAPATGIYTFNVSYFADGIGGSREVMIYKEGALYEKMAIEVGLSAIIPCKIGYYSSSFRGKGRGEDLYRSSPRDWHRNFAGYKVD
ncbi:MAG: hypothetical protein H6545_04465 [Bacteroidales bacterium]|nr:hypothetical protein [Bacteroidales bacterium]